MDGSQEFRRRTDQEANRTNLVKNLLPGSSAFQPPRRSKRLRRQTWRENDLFSYSTNYPSEESVSSDVDSDTDSCSSKRLCYGSDPGYADLAPGDSVLRRKKTSTRRKIGRLNPKEDVCHSRRLRRKTSITTPSTEESMEVEGGSGFPSMNELREAVLEIFPPCQQELPGGAQTLPGKRYAWLFEKFAPPPFRGLETISEVRTSPRQRRRYCRRSLAACTPRTMATRKRPLGEEPSGSKSEDRCQDAFWSKRALPRRLFFGTWDDSVNDSGDNTDEELQKFHRTAAKQKLRRREMMLRHVNRRPGELLRISDQTEQKFAIFWRNMESEEGDDK